MEAKTQPENVRMCADLILILILSLILQNQRFGASSVRVAVCYLPVLPC